jgi:hypothetical protein
MGEEREQAAPTVPASRPQAPHKRAGPMALPHFHQQNRSPDGHTFYETDKRKAKKQP